MPIVFECLIIVFFTMMLYFFLSHFAIRKQRLREVNLLTQGHTASDRGTGLDFGSS